MSLKPNVDVRVLEISGGKQVMAPSQDDMLGLAVNTAHLVDDNTVLVIFSDDCPLELRAKFLQDLILGEKTVPSILRRDGK